VGKQTLKTSERQEKDEEKDERKQRAITRCRKQSLNRTRYPSHLQKLEEEGEERKTTRLDQETS
jgi:hypothetical protein